MCIGIKNRRRIRQLRSLQRGNTTIPLPDLNFDANDYTLQDSIHTSKNNSIKTDKLDDVTVSSNETDNIERRNEGALNKMMAKMKKEMSQNSCPSLGISSSIKQPVAKRSPSVPTNFCPKSIMLVRTNEESLKRKTLKHTNQHQRQTSSKEGESKKVNVAFDSVEIQQYPITLGDNPAVSCGPPLTIEWKPINKHTYSINKYERLQDLCHRRHSEGHRIGSSERWHLLLRLGLAPHKIQEREDLVAKERERRLKSLSLMSFMTFGLQARMELTCRGMKNFVARGRKVSERKWIQQGLEMDHEAFKQRSAAFRDYECDDQNDGHEDQNSFVGGTHEIDDHVDLNKNADQFTDLSTKVSGVGLSARDSNAKISLPLEASIFIAMSA